MDLYFVLLGITGTVPVALHVAAVNRTRGILTLDGLFLLGQWLMLAGTLALADPLDTVHVRYVELLTAFVVVFSLASLATAIVVPARLPTTRIIVPIQRARPTMAALAVAAIVVALYFYLVGYSAFYLGIRSVFGGVPADVTTLRLDSYAGERYLAPGYFNQAKNALLPGIAVICIHALFARRHPRRWLLSAGLAVVTITSLIGTGQRSAFVIFVVLLGAFINIGRIRLGFRRSLIAALACIFVFLISTVALARGIDSTGGVPLADRAARAGGQAVERVLVDNQLAGLVAFAYTDRIEVAYGDEWGRALAGVLPGNRGSDLANRVFEIMYGSRRGTSPPSLVGSLHHNFRAPGVVGAAVLLGLVYQALTASMFRPRTLHIAELVGMAGVAAVGGTWIASGPTYPLDGGMLVFAGFWFVGRAARARLPIEPAEPDASEIDVGRFSLVSPGGVV